MKWSSRQFTNGTVNSSPGLHPQDIRINVRGCGIHENRTEIISFLFDEAGDLKQIVSTTAHKVFYAKNAFVPVTYTMTIEIRDTDAASITKKIADQDVILFFN